MACMFTMSRIVSSVVTPGNVEPMHLLSAPRPLARRWQHPRPAGPVPRPRIRFLRYPSPLRATPTKLLP
jgi:hypothetical protein